VPPKKAKNGKRLLVLGGTRFLGPAIVDHALAQGWQVTLYNRGISNPELYPDLDKRVGDRDTGDYSALDQGEWDVVVDTSCYVPQHARAAATALKDKVGHYVLISTISVYDALNGGASPSGPIDEDTQLSTMDNEVAESFMTIGSAFEGGMNFYGPLKALCERAVEAVMPGRTTSLRPGVIAGPDDPSDRFTYWVARVADGGQVLAPGDPAADFQFTDVKDLGRWAVEFGAAQQGGAFNAIGFPGKVSMQEFLHGCKLATGQTQAKFTWADEAFLLEHDVTPFMELPFWLPADSNYRVANQKGLAAGMTFRPITDTIQDVLAWHRAERPADYKWRGYGMQREREVELLAKWHAR
jgi:2'-hydroxyisoflavone reductase